jgi:hypothetical protein
MWKIPVPVLCLAALPLLGCAGDYTGRQAAAVTSSPIADTLPYHPKIAPYYPAAAPQVYSPSPAAPVAVLVFLPGADSVVASAPALWEAQGFDVVTPRAADLYRLVADQQAAMARLIASAEAMANAPIWLVGPSQMIETAIPATGGRVSGVIVTSETTPTYSCSESFFYRDPGTGAPPQVRVAKSGDCGSGMPPMMGNQPSLSPPPAVPRRNQPRIIEASTAGKHLPPGAQVSRLAQLIKAVPPG